MEYTKLGSTGLTVSELCFATWRFGKENGGVVETDREQAHALLDTAWDRGINFVDTANGYGDGRSEEWIGEWLDDHDREDVVLASKVYRGMESRFDQNLSRKNIRAEIEGTLSRLDTDYLDLYYIHRWDDETPIDETLRTLNRLVEDGRVHYLGASSMAAWQLTKALWESDVAGLERFDVTQPKFNAAYRDEFPTSSTSVEIKTSQCVRTRRSRAASSPANTNAMRVLRAGLGATSRGGRTSSTLASGTPSTPFVTSPRRSKRHPPRCPSDG